LLPLHGSQLCKPAGSPLNASLWRGRVHGVGPPRGRCGLPACDPLRPPFGRNTVGLRDVLARNRPQRSVNHRLPYAKGELGPEGLGILRWALAGQLAIFAVLAITAFLTRQEGGRVQTAARVERLKCRGRPSSLEIELHQTQGERG